jgi:hypothetical protein
MLQAHELRSLKRSSKCKRDNKVSRSEKELKETRNEKELKTENNFKEERRYSISPVFVTQFLQIYI